jgi:hypothetical protein
LESIIAIAARNKLVILLKALDPESPSTLIKNLDRYNISPASKILRNIAIIVAKIPYSPIIINDVVRTAGPAIKGVPIRYQAHEI